MKGGKGNKSGRGRERGIGRGVKGERVEESGKVGWEGRQERRGRRKVEGDSQRGCTLWVCRIFATELEDPFGRSSTDLFKSVVPKIDRQFHACAFCHSKSLQFNVHA